jgi:hypothetical protein
VLMLRYILCTSESVIRILKRTEYLDANQMLELGTTVD